MPSFCLMQAGGKPQAPVWLPAGRWRAMADLARGMIATGEAAKCRKIEPSHTLFDLSDCQPEQAHANL